MTRMVDRLQKIADKFEYKILKKAQSFDASTLSSDIEVGYQADAFQKWLDENFSQSDKNAIATKIANDESVEDLKSLVVSLMIKNKNVEISSALNGKDSNVAKKYVQEAILPKINPVLNKFQEGSKYVGWIRFPK